MGIEGVLGLILFVLYFYCIIYCYLTAKKLGKSTDLALLAGCIFSVWAALYYWIDYKAKKKAGKYTKI